MKKILFSDFTIDLDTMSLTNGGRNIKIGQRALDTLLFLMEHRDRIVSKELLRRTIWKSERISTSTIPMCIAEIRRALTDNADAPQFVASIRGKGYRFLPLIRTESTSLHREDVLEEIPFIGRASTLTDLDRLIRLTGSEMRGRAATVVGAAGIGKSRLVTELRIRIAHFADVVIVRCPTQSHDIPFGVWSRALDAIARLRGKEQRARIRNTHNQPTSIRSQASYSQGNFSPLSASRSRLFSEMSSEFKSHTRNRPLVIAIEDLHFADGDSLAFFEYMSVAIEEFPIVLLATTRPSLIARSASHSIRSDDSTVCIQSLGKIFHLDNLSPTEVRSFLDAHHNSPESTTSMLFRLTSGNPFFLNHVVRSLRSRNLNDGKPINTTSLVADCGLEIITEQLSDMPALTRGTLAFASVIGESFETLELAACLKTSTDALHEALEAARQGEIIHEANGRYSFHHTLLRDALYLSTSHHQRISSHSAVANEIQRHPSATKRGAEIFFHLAQAYPTVDEARTCQIGLAAADDALQRYAHQEALSILEIALTIAEAGLGACSPIRFTIATRLARTMIYMGRRKEARTLLLNEAAIARRHERWDDLAECALGIAPDFLSIEVGTYDTEMAMLLSEALQHLPGHSQATRARVLARLSQLAQWDPTPIIDPEGLANESLISAQQSSDPGAMLFALAAHADAARGPDKTDERIRRIAALRSAIEANSDPYGYLLQQTRLIAALLEKGEIRVLSAENERYRSIANRLNVPQYSWYPISTDSMLSCLAGKIELAESQALLYRSVAGSNPDENVIQTYACQHVLREIERGRSSSILGMVESFSRSHPTVYSWAAAVAWIQWDAGKFDAARESIRQFSVSDIYRLYREPGGTIGLAALAETCAYLGDRKQARILFDLLVSITDKYATAGYGVAYFGTIARYAALLAASLRHMTDALKLVQAAIRNEYALGAQSWLQYSKLDRTRIERGSLAGRRAGGLTTRDLISHDALLCLPRASNLVIRVDPTQERNLLS